MVSINLRKEKREMADEKRIIGWFYRNGKRIPITEKKGTEKDLKSIVHNGQEVRKGSTIDIPGGKGTVERIYETSNPELLYKNRIRVRDNKKDLVHDFATGREENPSFGRKSITKRSPNPEGIRKAADKKRKYAYALPQKKSYTGTPSEDYIKRVMKERGLSRPDAIRHIKDM